MAFYRIDEILLWILLIFVTADDCIPGENNMIAVAYVRFISDVP